MKKNKIENLLHSKGYVSIEVLIIAGLLIATGTFLTSKLVLKGKDVANSNNKNMTVASKTMDDNSFSNNISTDQSQLVKEEKSKHTMEKPADLTDFDYAIIGDNYINDELKKLDEKINDLPSDIPAPPLELTNNLKSNIKNLKEFSGGIIITGYHGNKTDIEIPSYIDDKEVVAIAPMAFAPKIPEPSENDMSEPPEGKLKSVKLPNTLKCIGDNAFMLNQLTNITIPDSVTKIYSSAFRDNKLKSVKLSNTLKYIGDDAFSSNQLTDIAIPDSVLEVGNNAFDRNKIISIKLGSNLKKIDEWAFANNNLISVTIPDNVVEICNSAFRRNKLKSIKLSSNLKEIGTWAFSENELESVIIPDSVTEINNFSFERNKLTSIKLGSNLKDIGNFAFAGNKLESVIVPDNVTSLGCGVFEHNPLKKKIIPKNCEEAKLPTPKVHK
ncbi:leucine-rich repeat domain-containing protein [Clostridium perfringens]|uniref:leucine-rich repeat domain-containing protein n=1 Tax=Clostridium perfringens TaxID=1502 RepID=UPI0039E7651F